MTNPPNIPPSIEQRLLEQPRPTVGIDSHWQPVRLGERDSTGYLVGYIDEHGLAWQSLSERIVAIHGHHLATAMARPYDDPRRDQLIHQALADVPDELIAKIAREAAGHLWLNDQRPP
jgi:hypothetical protein